MVVKDDFPKGEFRALGWVLFSDKYWWSRMVGFVLEDLSEDLIQTNLYAVVRDVQYDITQSNHHFFAMLERYNQETCTFFTPFGEMGFALHEMCEVSGLVMGDIPYEEYVPLTEELHVMEESALLVYATYWKVLCHFTYVPRLLG